MDPKGAQTEPQEAKMEPQSIKKHFQNTTAKKVEKGRVQIIAFGTIFVQKSIHKSVKKKPVFQIYKFPKFNENVTW